MTKTSPKILGLGLSRTGTTSLSMALEILGYRCFHYPFSLDDIERCDAAVDIPVFVWREELRVRYPDARFICSTRELKPWLRSCEAHFLQNSLPGSTDPEMCSHMQAMRLAVYGATEFSVAGWTAAWQQHQEQIDQFAQKIPDRFMHIAICDDAGWPELCGFLNCPVPDHPFPKLNRR